MQTDFQFQVGQLVQHVRYGYRGVVAARDDRCEATEAWYRSNATTPERGQAWYHVLVHGERHTTYVAQENLESDGGGEQVVHPLTKSLFEYFQRGCYQPRNDVRFPSWPRDDEA